MTLRKDEELTLVGSIQPPGGLENLQKVRNRGNRNLDR